MLNGNNTRILQEQKDEIHIIIEFIKDNGLTLAKKDLSIDGAKLFQDALIVAMQDLHHHTTNKITNRIDEIDSQNEDSE